MGTNIPNLLHVHAALRMVSSQTVGVITYDVARDPYDWVHGRVVASSQFKKKLGPLLIGVCEYSGNKKS